MNVAELKQKWTNKMAAADTAYDSAILPSEERVALAVGDVTRDFLRDLESLAAQPVCADPVDPPMTIADTLYMACRAAWFAKPEERSGVMDSVVSPAMEAYWAHRKSLGSYSSPAAVEVTDEMVESACKASQQARGFEDIPIHPRAAGYMRAALSAALRGK